MTPEEYRIQRMELDETSKFLTHKEKLFEAFMGLTSEAGEAQQELSRHYFRDASKPLIDIISELGDVVWYLDAALYALGSNFSELFEVNIKKLEHKKYINAQHRFASDLARTAYELRQQGHVYIDFSTVMEAMDKKENVRKNNDETLPTEET